MQISKKTLDVEKKHLLSKGLKTKVKQAVQITLGYKELQWERKVLENIFTTAETVQYTMVFNMCKPFRLMGLEEHRDIESFTDAC